MKPNQLTAMLMGMYEAMIVVPATDEQVNEVVVQWINYVCFFLGDTKDTHDWAKGCLNDCTQAILIETEPRASRFKEQLTRIIGKGEMPIVDGQHRVKFELNQKPRLGGVSF